MRPLAMVGVEGEADWAAGVVGKRRTARLKARKRAEIQPHDRLTNHWLRMLRCRERSLSQFLLRWKRF